MFPNCFSIYLVLVTALYKQICSLFCDDIAKCFHFDLMMMIFLYYKRLCDDAYVWSESLGTLTAFQWLAKCLNRRKCHWMSRLDAPYGWIWGPWVRPCWRLTRRFQTGLPGEERSSGRRCLVKCDKNVPIWRWCNPPRRRAVVAENGLLLKWLLSELVKWALGVSFREQSDCREGLKGKEAVLEGCIVFNGWHVANRRSVGCRPLRRPTVGRTA